jgi:hypothetical protein
MNIAATAHRRMVSTHKLAGILFAALLFPALPAAASDAAMREQTPLLTFVDAGSGRVPIHFDAPATQRSGAGDTWARDLPNAENQWSSGATSEWNAGLNRAVDRIVNPPERFNVHANQPGDHRFDKFEDPRGGNGTLAGFTIEFH